MDENNDHHQGRAPVMDTTDQPSEGDTFHDVLNGGVGMIGRGSVVDGKENAGEPLKNKKEQTCRAKCIPPVTFWFRAIEQVLINIVQAKPFIQPVKDLFPHGSAFLIKDFENAFIGDAEIRVAVKWARRGTVQNFSLHIKFGIVTRTKEGFRFILPIDGASQMGTTTVEKEQVIEIFRFANDKSTVAGGRPLPAVDLDLCE